MEAADFVNKILQRKPANRLGFNGPNDVKNHMWFKSIDWQKMINKQVDAPYLPIHDTSKVIHNEKLCIE